jgi:hypothetical protein
MEKHYLPWAKENKRHPFGDFSRYANWLKPRFATQALKDISPLDLERLKREMREAGKSEATTKHALCIMRKRLIRQWRWRLWSGENPCKGHLPQQCPATVWEAVRFLNFEAT